MKCSCENIDFGTYANTVVLIYPFPTQRYPQIGTKEVLIDRCIALEVVELWNQGIETIESCCGHNKAAGYICVPPEYDHRMIEEGYERYDESKPHHFKPKSVSIVGMWEAYCKYRNVIDDKYTSPMVEDFNWFIKNYPNV